eukprot:scaffold19084_cov64-Phaeocystis_antarctica.AAC.5
MSLHVHAHMHVHVHVHVHAHAHVHAHVYEIVSQQQQLQVRPPDFDAVVNASAVAAAQQRPSSASCAGARRASTWSTKGPYYPLKTTPPRESCTPRADVEHTTQHTRSTGSLPSAWPARAWLSAGGF